MSYTKYPAEAANFTTTAHTLKKEVDDVINGLNEANGILTACSSKDLIVARSIESISNIITRIKPMKNNITSDINTVNRIADDLESEEYQRILRRQQEENDKSGDVNE